MKVILHISQISKVKLMIESEMILDKLFQDNMISEEDEKEPDMIWDFETTKEKLDLSKNWVKTKEDAIQYLKILKNKVKELPDSTKQKILKYVAFSFLGLLSLKQISTYLDPPLQRSVETEKEIIKKIRTVSDSLYDHLRYEEGSIRHKGQPNLVAYDIGDGAYTIGYGHAIFPNENEGYDFLPSYNKIVPHRTTITKENAETLLYDDVKIAEDIINKILNDWENKGIKPEITQGMYNAMVSMAFNMGTGIRTSDFIQAVKRGDLKLAKKLILTTSENLFDDYPGLEKRRQHEYKMFV